jgi:hypothetical protein
VCAVDIIHRMMATAASIAIIDFTRNSSTQGKEVSRFGEAILLFLS